MHDLRGIDHCLTFLDRRAMSPQDLGRTTALQSGAFISDWNHSKFDKSTDPLCAHCLTRVRTQFVLIAFAPVTFIEFAIWCIVEQELPVPLWNPDTVQWEARSYHAAVVKPTIAFVVQFVRFVFIEGLRLLGLDRCLIKGLQKPESGVFLQSNGVVV